jgi:hypothetical protein
VLCLDHDLGGEVYVDPSRPDCGMEVVRWMAENRPEVGRVIIHSLNTSASLEMERQLRAAGYADVRQCAFKYFEALVTNLPG